MELDEAHIDRIQALYCAEGYREARKEFDARYYGGEVAVHAFECAMLTFFEAQRKKITDMDVLLHKMRAIDFSDTRPFNQNPATHKDKGNPI